MSAWGTGLYTDDTACDVRDDYVAHLRAGASDEDAAARIVVSYKDVLELREVACIVYFALADTCWKYGRVDSEVIKEALRLLEDGGDLVEWERDAPAELPRRKKTLDALRRRLLSEPPPRKRVAVVPLKPKKVRTTCPAGSVFMLPLPGGGNALLVLAGMVDTGKIIEPAFTVMDWRGHTAPSDADLAKICRNPIVIPHVIGPLKHAGIIPEPRQKGLPAELVPTGLVCPYPLPFDPFSVVFTGEERLVSSIEKLLSPGASGSAGCVRKSGRRCR